MYISLDLGNTHIMALSRIGHRTIVLSVRYRRILTRRQRAGEERGDRRPGHKHHEQSVYAAQADGYTRHPAGEPVTREGEDRSSEEQAVEADGQTEVLPVPREDLHDQDARE